MIDRSLRIAMISEHASPLAVLGGEDAGGQNVYVAELSRHLAALGHIVDVFTRRDDPNLPPVVAWLPGVRVVHLPAGPPEPLKKDLLFPEMPRFRDALLAFVRRDGAVYDVVHAHFWMSGWVACEVAPALEAPVVQTFHALGAIKRLHQGTADTSPPERHDVEQRILNEAAAIVATCPAERDDLHAHYRTRPERVHIVPCGVDVERFRPLPRDEARASLGLPPHEPVVVYVGRVLPRKGIDTIIRGVAELRRRTGLRARLLVVGGEREDARPTDNLEIRRLLRVAVEEGVAEQVRFEGRRPQDDLFRYYSAADAFATTPWYEPFGMTPLEAMACQTPVVASRVGGHQFTVVDGATGYLVPPRDPAALAAALERVLRDPVLRDRMGAAGRARTLAHFTWERVAGQVAEVYRSAVAVSSVRALEWAATAPTPRKARDGRRRLP